jgi:hypothetical protein
MLKVEADHTPWSRARFGRKGQTERKWLFALLWSNPDVIGLFSNNVVSFSRNVVLSSPSFSSNVESGKDSGLGRIRHKPSCRIMDHVGWRRAVAVQADVVVVFGP